MSVGLGFAFMRLSAADTRRLLRSAKAAVLDAGGEVPAGEPQLPDWLPEGRHSQPLPSLGRGVTAAWAAGRVYVYAPAPLDLFMQTTELRAGVFDAALRPPSLPTGVPWSAWPGAHHALAAASAGNPALRAALHADAAFPAELLGDWDEEEDDEEADENEHLLAADELFAPRAAVPDVPVNFAPGGLQLPKAKLLPQPWRMEDYVDETLERLQAGRPTAEEIAEERGWPQLPELEAVGVFLTDEHYGVLPLHSCDIFIRKTEDELLDLREAWGVDKEGTLDGMSEDWSYTDRWWFAAENVPPDTQPSDYHPVYWTRRPTLPGSRGDRRHGDVSFLVDWAEEVKRIYLVRSLDTFTKAVENQG
jgi:hypothetical protein